eukprot:12936881-Prorocentrum_lima.AAC.1
MQHALVACRHLASLHAELLYEKVDMPLLVISGSYHCAPTPSLAPFQNHLTFPQQECFVW